MNESHDGDPVWPASPYDLGDAHKCPACFAVVTQAVCANCGLDLGDTRTPRVLRYGREILRLELERQGYIQLIRETTRMRDAEAAARAAAPAITISAFEATVPALDVDAPAALAVTEAAAPVLESEAPVAAAAGAEDAPGLAAGVATGLLEAAAAESSTLVEPAAPGWPPPQNLRKPDADVREPRPPRRRLTVPVLLLIVGVSLVGVAAVFFLVFAWFVWGIAVRALIIGGITVASMGAASWLRRRSLTATAEGIGALGIVLLGLDAWAVRANDFFGTAAADPFVYAGVATLVIGGVCRVWARFSGLRGPDLAAAVALPTGLGLLIGGLVPLPPAEAAVAGLLGAAAGGLAHALPAPWSSSRGTRAGIPERLVLALIGLSALVAAVFVTLFATAGVGVVLWADGLVFVLGLAHAWLLRRRPDVESLPQRPALAGIASSVAVAALSLAAWQVALRLPADVDLWLLPPVLSVLVAVAADIAQSRRAEARAAATTAAVIAVAAMAGAGIAWWVQAAARIQSTWITWQTDPFAVPPGTPAQAFLAIGAAVAISALLFFAPSLARPRSRDARAVAAAVLVLGAAAVPAVPALVVGADILMAAVAVFALRRSPAVAGWMITGGFAVATAYVQSAATPWLWVVAAVAAIGLPVAWRFVLRPAGAAAVALAVAPVVIAAVSAVIAPAPLGAVLGVSGPALGTAAALVQWVAVAAIAALFLPLDRASRTALATAGELLALATLLMVVYVATNPAATGDADAVMLSAIGDPLLAVVRGALLVAGMTALALRIRAIATEAAVAAALLIAPTLAGALHALLGLFGAADAPWSPVVLVAGSVTAVAVAAWAASRAALVEGMPHLRVCVEGGAAASTLVVAPAVAPEFAWAVWMLVATGFGVAAVTRGWADVTTSPDDDVYATSAAGAELRAAPRRLLVWPAAVAALAAWWLWLGAGTPRTFPVEASAVPAGAALIALACALVWLRRRIEASVAVAGGLALALWWPGLESWSAAPVRGTVVALAGAALCLALAWSPLRRVRPPAPLGALAALVATGIVSVERAMTGSPSDALWLLLFAGAALASALGFAQAEPERLSSRGYAEAVAPAALAVATVAVLPMGGDSVVMTTALAILAVLHVAAAGLHRAPLTGVTRWTALGGAVAVGVAGFAPGGLPQVESATLPLAGALLAGAALATLRRRRDGLAWPASESAVWVSGILLATAPSLFAPVDPIRMWTIIGASLAGAIGIAFAPIPMQWRVRTPSAALLAAAALAMGVRALAAPGVPGAEAAALAAGLGAIAVAAVLISTTPTSQASWAPTALTAAASALVLAVILIRSDGELATTVVTALAGGVVGLSAAALLAWRRWRSFAAVLAVGGLLAAWAACGMRFLVVLAQPGFEGDFWALIGGAIAVSIALAAVRATRSPAISYGAGALLALTALLIAVAELVLISWHEPFAQWRTLATMTGLTAATLAGLVWRSRIGLTLALVAGASGALFALVSTFGFGVTPFELVTVPAALGGLANGVQVLLREPESRTWPVLGPWLALLLLPSLLYDFFASGELWRIVTLGIVALGLVVVGAVMKLQAPLVLGSIVLLVHGVAQLWPWISTAYVAVPWWLWLGAGGALLIFLAATYERHMRQMRAAVVAVTSLR